MKSKKVAKKAPAATGMEFLTEGSVFQRKDTGRFCTVVGVANKFTKNPKMKPSQVIFFDPMGRLWSESVAEFLDRREFYNVDPSSEARILELLSQSNSETKAEEKTVLDEFEQLLAETTGTVAPKQEKPKNLFGFDDVEEDAAEETQDTQQVLSQEEETQVPDDDSEDLLVVDDGDDDSEDVSDDESTVKSIDAEPFAAVSSAGVLKQYDTSGFEFRFENTEALPSPGIQEVDLAKALLYYEQDSTSFEDAMYALHKFTFVVDSEKTREAIRACFTVEEKPTHKIVERISNAELNLFVDWDASVDASKGWRRDVGETLTIVLGVKDEPVHVEHAEVLEVTPEIPAQQG